MGITRDEVAKRLNTVFQDVFEDDTIEIYDEMTAKNVSRWDSFMHIVLVVAAEKEFGVELKAAAVGKLQNVGEMIDLFLSKLN